MNKMSNAVAAAIAAVILAGTSPVFAQEQTETAPQEQNPMMDAEGMQGSDMQGMMGMMQMMSQMSEMMENCNRMMKAMAPQDATPETEPEQDNG